VGLASLGVVFDGLPINTVGSTILLLVAMFSAIFAFALSMTYFRISRNVPRRFGFSRSGIHLEYPLGAPPRKFRYLAWSDLTSVSKGARVTGLSSLWVKTRFGTQAWWGVPDDFAGRLVAASKKYTTLPQ
jgi:hypothetical protein